MGFEVGSLVRARGREWVVLPPDQEDSEMLMLRPLGGTEDEVSGIYPPLEKVEPAQFGLPDPNADMGNLRSCNLLRNALRLGFRSGAGPFRSLARIAVEPRPYQIVPLLMALRLNPIRLLIADDVGIGKTIEACLIVRELLDRGEIERLAVLCPPHLAEQWQKALSEQFHIEAKVVLPGTVARLERACRLDESLFERYPFTVISTDYIKSERHRHEFLNSCPEMVIVDEAHTCASAPNRSTTQKRHELLRDLTDPDVSAHRHVVLVTATPHSGDEETFRSLVALLDRGFADLPGDLSGDVNRKHREHLARHFVQRRRGDLKAYLDSVTPFPNREIATKEYDLKPAYRKFFDRVLDYCKESVLEEGLLERHQRVRWWSALALLRALGSSPAAAAATLRTRSTTADSDTAEQANEAGMHAVLDLDEESTEGIDFIPGSDTGEEGDATNRERLLRLAREAESLQGKGDAKLSGAIDIVRQFLRKGQSPILYCRFIPTAEYVGAAIRDALKADEVEVRVVTGKLPPEERESRVTELQAHPKRVLVCTDCMSEGINLQQHFDTVMHYDLSWNPTRHEQREGRVDRYGQPKDTVRTLTYYGRNNPVDLIVYRVLLRKHATIHKQLGVIVPVPMDANFIATAILKSLLHRNASFVEQMSLDLESYQEVLGTQWDAAVGREKRSRTLFAQNQLLKTVNDEVRDELEEVRKAIGGSADVRQFTTDALAALGATLSGTELLHVDVSAASPSLKDAIGVENRFNAVFNGRSVPDAIHLTRTHPIVAGLATTVMESALDPALGGPGRRCGAVRTNAVSVRTTLLLLRARFQINDRVRDDNNRLLLAEDLTLIAFTGAPQNAQWVPSEDIEIVLSAGADANIGKDQAKSLIQRVLENLEHLREHLELVANRRGIQLAESHHRVRKAVSGSDRAPKVKAHKPSDIIGVYVFIPAGMQARP